MSYDPQAAVKKGAALLDERCPGWYRDVEITRISMHTWEGCLSSQIRVDGPLYRGRPYDRLMAALDLHDGNPHVIQTIGGKPAEYGFTIPTLFEDDVHYTTAFDLLSALWKEEVRARQSADTAQPETTGHLDR